MSEDHATPAARYHIGHATPIISFAIGNRQAHHGILQRIRFSPDVATASQFEVHVGLGIGNESSAHQYLVGRCHRRIVGSSSPLSIRQQIIGDNVNKAQKCSRECLRLEQALASASPRETVLELASNLVRAA